MQKLSKQNPIGSQLLMSCASNPKSLSNGRWRFTLFGLRYQSNRRNRRKSAIHFHLKTNPAFEENECDAHNLYHSYEEQIKMKNIIIIIIIFLLSVVSMKRKLSLNPKNIKRREKARQKRESLIYKNIVIKNNEESIKRNKRRLIQNRVLAARRAQKM